MMRLTYTGQQPIHVVDGGNWESGDTRDVTDGLAQRLLARSDFQKANRPPAKKPAKASAGAPQTAQEACGKSSN